MKKIGLLLGIILIGTSCERDVPIPNEDYIFKIPEGFPTPPYQFEDNEVSEAGFELGRRLFYDPLLSKDNSISCGSCHQQFAAFAHAEHDVSHGINGLLGDRNAPGLFNLAWHPLFFHDGGGTHIENQPIGPIENPVEMDEELSSVVAKLAASADYKARFKEAFGSDSITTKLMLKAITQFQGMFVSANSKYDQVLRGEASFNGNESAGHTLFQNKCASCHATELFSDYEFRNNGLDTAFADLGREKITGLASDRGKFKTPSLRNIEFTGPYMHDGSIKTLEKVLDHYDSKVLDSPTLAPELKAGGIPLTEEEKTKIIAFLKTLSDYEFLNDQRFTDPF